MVGNYNPDIHHRRSIRLKHYDYAQAGAYFVTICSWKKECVFGEIVDGKMRLNDFGQIVKREWLQAGVIRRNVELDVFVVMPNNMHGIIMVNDIVGATRRVALKNNAINNRAIHRIAPTLQSNSIGSIIGQFKSIVTKHINQIRNTPGLSVWQRNYYEHIIRNEDESNRVREYIVNNSLQWEDDENNPINFKRK